MASAFASLLRDRQALTRIPPLRDFTKRLIFSAWSVVPKAIAAMLSYEAERRAIEAAGYSDRRYDDRPITPPLQFRMNGGRPAGMPALALLYPGLILARLGDPLEVARTLGTSMPLARQALLDTVRDRIQDVLAKLPEGSPRSRDTGSTVVLGSAVPPGPENCDR